MGGVRDEGRKGPPMEQTGPGEEFGMEETKEKEIETKKKMNEWWDKGVGPTMWVALAESTGGKERRG